MTAIDRPIGLANKVAEANLSIVKERFLNGVPTDPWKASPP